MFGEERHIRIHQMLLQKRARQIFDTNYQIPNFESDPEIQDDF